MDLGAGLVCDFKTQHCASLKTNAVIKSCNRAMHENQPTSTEINSIKEFFGATPFSWAVEETDVETIQALETNGLNYRYAFPAMKSNLAEIKELPYQDHIEIREIDDDSQLCIWLSIISLSHSRPLEELTKVFAYLKTHAAPGALKYYLGFYEGRPVAASMVICHSEAVSLHWVSTLPDYRGKGLGFAVSHKPLVDAHQLGYGQAVLLAGDLGESIYKRIGFESYAVYRMYINKL